MTLEDVLAALKSAERIGAAEDTPEGSRFIQLSDTLASQMIEAVDRELDSAVNELPPGKMLRGR